MATSKQLVFATRNRGKLAELAELLRDHGTELELLTLDSVDVPDVEENGHTFTANARKKANEVSRFTGLPALADDSGVLRLIETADCTLLPPTLLDPTASAGD